MFKTYYRLTKPGIIRGNAITAAAGFFLASKGDIDWKLFVAMLVGLSLIIASACVFNNYLDRDIDAKMARTKKRALPSGEISEKAALIYASVLELTGAFILAVFTNILTLAVALVGLFFYVVVYGLAKRRTVHGTVVGSISGAVPPVVGYVAVADRLDITAVVLFLILVFWQMPHFYAIAIFRLKDYAAASIPVLPIKKSIRATKIQMIIYIYAFTAAAAALHLLGHAGDVYLAVSLLIGIAWLWVGIKGFQSNNDERWARKMFGYSLIILLVWSIVISIDFWLV